MNEDIRKILNLIESPDDGPDKIEMTIPLFLRCLEWAREDSPSDVDLHIMTENAIAKNDILDIHDYDSLLTGTSSSKE